MNTQTTASKMLSFLDPAQPQPWASFIEQIDAWRRTSESSATGWKR